MQLLYSTVCPEIYVGFYSTSTFRRNPTARKCSQQVEGRKEMDENDLDFDNDSSLGCSSVSHRSSQSSSISSLLTGEYRTKSKRKRMMRFVQPNEEDNDHDRKTVRFSLSPPRESINSELSSTPSRCESSRSRSHRNKVRSSCSSTTNDDSQSTNSLDSIGRSLSQQSSQRFSSDASPQLSQRDSHSSSKTCQGSPFFSPDVDVRGAGTDVMAVKDAGSYRMLFDDCSYLCSIIVGGSPLNAFEAACDLALLLSKRKTRAILLTEGGGAALSAILEALSSVPEPSLLNLDGILGVEQEDHESLCRNGVIMSTEGKLQSASKRLSKNGRKRALGRQEESGRVVKINCRYQRPLNEALACVVDFLSWDCTISEHSSTGSASAARNLRSAILEHPNVLRGVCHLALMDPVSHDILSKILNKAEIAGHAIIDHDYVKSECLMPSERDGKEGNCDSDDASQGSSSVTNESVASSQGDPTCMGRRKRRKRRRIHLERSEVHLDVITEDEEHVDLKSPAKRPVTHASLCMSFTSAEESLSQRWCGDDASVSTMASASGDSLEKLGEVRAALVQRGDGEVSISESSRHTCKTKEGAVDGRNHGRTMVSCTEGDFVLLALSRIVDGREGDEESCIEHGAEEGNQSVNSASQDSAKQDECDGEEQSMKNPLLATNILLRKSGTLPMLARAMTESLSALIVCVAGNWASCGGCLSHLKNRVSVLSSIIDGACCLTSENRHELCSGNSKLIPSILLFLKTFSDQKARRLRSQSSAEVALLDEIALSTLRTLTSLTHDNDVAGSLLMSSYNVNVSVSRTSTFLPGVLILANLLRQTALNSNSDEKRSSKHLHHAYDMVIFCLNTLSNAVKAENLPTALAEYTVPVTSRSDNSTGKGCTSTSNELFLTWLSRWLFNETISFRDAVMLGTFGEKAYQDISHEMRDLEKHEEEHLITAGNGFILLACLMIQSNVHDHQLSAKIRKLILDELQVNKNGGGLQLIKNTLKAFCNFYHYSLGDLSVAIVAPVGGIIAEVETMQAQSNGLN